MKVYKLDMRQRYIVTQALVIAIKDLEEVPAPYTEISNIADMKELLHTVFADLAEVVEYTVNAEKVGFNG